MNRGQIFSTDALLALIVFTLIIGLTLGILGQIQSTGENVKRNADRTAVTEQVLLLLLSSSGSPRNWESYSDRNEVKMIGLMNESGEMSLAKWSSFIDWNATDYSSLKSSLGIPDQNFYITLSDLNFNILSKAGTAPIDINKVSALTLPSIYQGKMVMVQLQVYQR